MNQILSRAIKLQYQDTNYKQDKKTPTLYYFNEFSEVVYWAVSTILLLVDLHHQLCMTCSITVELHVFGLVHLHLQTNKINVQTFLMAKTIAMWSYGSMAKRVCVHVDINTRQFWQVGNFRTTTSAHSIILLLVLYIYKAADSPGRHLALPIVLCYQGRPISSKLWQRGGGGGGAIKS